MKKVILSVFLVTTYALAQKPTHGINMAGQLILNRGTSLPATCTIGEVFFKTDASAGSNVYGCTATNTWTAQAGGTVSATSLDAIIGPGADLCNNPTVNGLALEVPFDKTCLEPLAFTDTGYRNASGGSWRPPEKTVSTLPTASSNTGKVYVATDGTSSSDCTTGSGSTRALCVSNGSAWVSLGGGGLATATTVPRWIYGPPDVTPSATLALSGSATLYFAFDQPYSATYTSIVLPIQTAGASGTTGLSVAIMDSSCNLVVRSSTVTGLNAFSSTAPLAATFASTTLTGGSKYYLGITSDDSTVRLMGTANQAGSYVVNLGGGSSTYNEFTGNAPTGSAGTIAAPSTCGTRTVINGASILFAYLRP